VIADDDPRHGTVQGHNARCRCAPCDLAKYRYDKQRKAELHATGQRRIVPAYRIQRRVEALQALGWSLRKIADEAGVTHNHMTDVRKFAWRTTFDAIDGVYQRLSMTFPPETTAGEKSGAVRTRNHARRNGYAPPLAWDEDSIDDPDAIPATEEYAPLRNANGDTKAIPVDDVVVDRILSGRVVPSTNAERREVVRRWMTDGRSYRALEALTGWRVERYYDSSDAA
jgi:hypothetical protein